MQKEDLHLLLDLLNGDEIEQLSKIFHLNSQRKEIFHSNSQRKESLKLQLLKYAVDEGNKPLFRGDDNVSEILRAKILEIVGPCHKVHEHIISIFDRMCTLFSPMLTTEGDITDLIMFMRIVNDKKVVFPQMPGRRFPLFQNRDHLLRFLKILFAFIVTDFS